MRRAPYAAVFAFFTGCVPVIYRGYTGYSGRVVDASTGQPLAGVAVTACLLDRFPGAHMTSCDSAAWKKFTTTDANGRFTVDGSRHLGIILPAPHLGPGPFDTN